MNTLHAHRLQIFSSRNTLAVLFAVLGLALSACGSSFEASPASHGTDSSKSSNPGNDDGGNYGPLKLVTLDETVKLRSPVSGILESIVALPVGTVVGIPTGYEVKYIDYRKEDGSIVRSSTGFLTPIRVISVPASVRWSDSHLESVNRTSGGLFVSASIIGALEGVTGDFAALAAAPAGAGYLTQYTANGKPKFNYTAAIVRRFGPRLNKAIPADSMSAGDRTRYERIYQELARFADRTRATPKSLLLIDRPTAVQLSVEYETSRTIPLNGAWTVAVMGTATRHGFENVPCAEFMSETIREAYQRAGYRVTDDFSASRGNELIWTKTAAVVGLSKALYDAGWVPWDGTKYRAPTGALLFNGAGNSPGHAYISAGDDARFIVDNGAPQGRDLRKTTGSTVGNMYQTGLFFLPPGIQPLAW